MLIPVILITVLFGPTSLVLTTDTPPSITELVERDASGRMTRINLPDRLVVIANHQAYLDWMYLWILSSYAGHSKGIIILLKASLKNVPIIGWGMVSYEIRDKADLSVLLNSSSCTDPGRLIENT